MLTPYEHIVNVDYIATGKPGQHPAEINGLALMEKDIPAADKDKQRNLVVAIDCQCDFILPDATQVARGEPYGTLSVPGAKGDIERLTRFIYGNMRNITRIMLSMDTHYPHQIFLRAMWRDENDMPVAPNTLITSTNFSSGKYRFMGDNPEKAKDCIIALEKAGKGGVFIWPDHCLIGTPGWLPDPQLMNMVHFHSAARNVEPIIVLKGADPYSEMYGFLEPEFNPDGIVTKPVLDNLASFDPQTGDLVGMKWDKVIFAGEAGSHCVPECLRQVIKLFRGYPDVIRRLYLLEDCISPVPGFEQQMKDALDEFARQGVNIVKSTDLVLSE